MNTEAKTLHIRRAEPTDAVNIFRLVVGEEKRAGTVVGLDDAARISDILVTISTGYVSVATISGRIVGSIGGLVSDASGNNVFAGAWFALSPSFHDTPVGSALLGGLMKAATEANLPVKFVLPVAPHATLREALIEAGFEPRTVVWGYDARERNEEPIESADDPDEDRGRDADVGEADADGEPAESDAEPTVTAA